MFGSQKFFITLENFSETVQKIDAALTKEKISKKESMNAQLLLEETFMRMVNLGNAEDVQVKLSKRFGNLNLTPEIVGAEIFTLALAIFTVSVGTPGIPGGGIILMAAIIGMFGVPAEAVAVILGIFPIVDRIDTTTNVVGDIGASTILAKTENLLDTNIYYKM